MTSVTKNALPPVSATRSSARRRRRRAPVPAPVQRSTRSDDVGPAEAVELHPHHGGDAVGTRRRPDPSGGRASSSSLRSVPTTSRRAGSGAAARLRSREAVPASAQCRSSRNSTSGARPASAAEEVLHRGEQAGSAPCRGPWSWCRGAGLDAVGRAGGRAAAHARPWRATWPAQHVLAGRCATRWRERVDERAGTARGRPPRSAPSPRSRPRRTSGGWRGRPSWSCRRPARRRPAPRGARRRRATARKATSSGVELHRPAHERGCLHGQAGRQRGGRRLRAVPRHLDGGDRAGQPLQRLGAGVLEPLGTWAAVQQAHEARWRAPGRRRPSRRGERPGSRTRRSSRRPRC